jgi:hypothetical protein
MKQLFRTLPSIALCATLSNLPAIATAEDTQWLYCEATRLDDGARVSYTFKIQGDIAEAKYGRWEVRETDRELRLTYIHADGRRDAGAFMVIDRFTGELFHSAYGISIYRTQAGDKPCQETEKRF